LAALDFKPSHLMKHEGENHMFIRPIILTCLLLLGVVASAQAAPGAPNFGEALWGDGELWGTKATTALPAPNAHNEQSFDALFVIIDGVSGQVPVSEAAPGNPDYNGGRWATHRAIWIEEPELLMSYADILYHEGEGNLMIVDGPPATDGPPAYFLCPLLPVK
jgi:hypothetical protein